jgi:SAM-dependent methyltransferase
MTHADTTLDYYFDPALYDASFAERSEDVELYLELAAAHPGPILELGAGTGRVTLPLARALHTVVAVDSSPQMLAALERELAKEPSDVASRVQLHEVDVRSLALEAKFSLILATFNVVGHLETPEDLLAFLSAARAHLAPGGELVFDTLAPDDAELLAEPDEEFELDPLVHPHTGHTLEATERFQYDFETRILTATTTYKNLTTSECFSVPLRLRQWFPRELEELTRKAGFSKVTLSADYGSGSDLTLANMIVTRVQA